MSAFVSPLVLWSLGAAAAAYALWKVLYFFVIERFTSPLRDLPSPPNPSWLYGNLQEISEAENSIRQEAWVQEYGTTLKYKGWFSVRRNSPCRTYNDADVHGSATGCTQSTCAQ